MRAVLVALFCVCFTAAAFTTTPPWQATVWISGTTFQAVEGMAWDGAGNLFVADAFTSNVGMIPVSKLPATSNADFTWTVAFGSSDHANGLLYLNGHLYLNQLLLNTILELNPANGAVIRTVTTAIPNPEDIHVDPISGDVFVSSIAGSGGLYRIKNIASNSPIVTQYVSISVVDGFTFAADGSMYAVSLAGQNVYKIDATNVNVGNPQATVFYTGIPVPDGSAIATCQGQQYLIVDSETNGQVHSVPLTDPSTHSIVLTGAASKLDLANVGPDGAFYVTEHYDPTDNPPIRLFRITNPNCTFTPPPTGACPGCSDTFTASTQCSSSSHSSASNCATLAFSDTVSGSQC